MFTPSSLLKLNSHTFQIILKKFIEKKYPKGSLGPKYNRNFAISTKLLNHGGNNYLAKCWEVLFSKPRFIEIFFSSSEVRASAEIVRDESRFVNRTFQHFG